MEEQKNENDYQKSMEEFHKKYRTVIDKNGRIHFVPINKNKPTPEEVEKAQWGVIVFSIILIVILFIIVAS